MIGAAVDVTERRRAEEALRNTEKLAAAGRLAASIAHEINNPLEAVTNLVFLARTTGATNANGARLLTIAEEELKRAARLTNRLSVFIATAPFLLALTSQMQSTTFYLSTCGERKRGA